MTKVQFKQPQVIDSKVYRRSTPRKDENGQITGWRGKIYDVDKDDLKLIPSDEYIEVKSKKAVDAAENKAEGGPAAKK